MILTQSVALILAGILISSIMAAVTTTAANAQTTTVPPSSTTTPYPPPEPKFETLEEKKNKNNIYVDITNPHNDTSRIITNLTWYTENRLESNIVIDPDGTSHEEYGETKVAEPLSPENIQYQQEDPNFNRLAQLTYDCLNDYHTIWRTHTIFTVESKTRQTWCVDEINKEINQICENAVGATFNAPLNNKCEEAREMSGVYVQLAETLYG